MPTWSIVVNSSAGRPVCASSGRLSCRASCRRRRAPSPAGRVTWLTWRRRRPARLTLRVPARRPGLRGVLSKRSPASAAGALEASMSQLAQTRSVIVGGARTPMGRLLGSLKDFSAADLGGVAIKAALERAGITGDQVDYVIMGQVIQAGAGPEPGPPGRGRRRHPDVGALVHAEQGLPVRPRRDRAGRPADPGRRVRDRGRRRHGVDDPGAAPADRLAHRHQVRRRRRWSTRWPTTASPTPSTRSRWAS